MVSLVDMVCDCTGLPGHLLGATCRLCSVIVAALSEHFLLSLVGLVLIDAALPGPLPSVTGRLWFVIVVAFADHRLGGTGQL